MNIIRGWINTVRYRDVGSLYEKYNKSIDENLKTTKIECDQIDLKKLEHRGELKTKTKTYKMTFKGANLTRKSADIVDKQIIHINKAIEISNNSIKTNKNEIVDELTKKKVALETFKDPLLQHKEQIRCQSHEIIKLFEILEPIENDLVDKENKKFKNIDKILKEKKLIKEVLDKIYFFRREKIRAILVNLENEDIDKYNSIEKRINELYNQKSIQITKYEENVKKRNVIRERVKKGHLDYLEAMDLYSRIRGIEKFAIDEKYLDENLRFDNDVKREVEKTMIKAGEMMAKELEEIQKLITAENGFNEVFQKVTSGTEGEKEKIDKRYLYHMHQEIKKCIEDRTKKLESLLELNQKQIDNRKNISKEHFVFHESLKNTLNDHLKTYGALKVNHENKIKEHFNQYKEAAEKTKTLVQSPLEEREKQFSKRIKQNLQLIKTRKYDLELVKAFEGKDEGDNKTAIPLDVVAPLVPLESNFTISGPIDKDEGNEKKTIPLDVVTPLDLLESNLVLFDSIIGFEDIKDHLRASLEEFLKNAQITEDEKDKFRDEFKKDCTYTKLTVIYNQIKTQNGEESNKLLNNFVLSKNLQKIDRLEKEIIELNKKIANEKKGGLFKGAKKAITGKAKSPIPALEAERNKKRAEINSLEKEIKEKSKTTEYETTQFKKTLEEIKKMEAIEKPNKKQKNDLALLKKKLDSILENALQITAKIEEEIKLIERQGGLIEKENDALKTKLYDDMDLAVKKLNAVLSDDSIQRSLDEINKTYMLLIKTYEEKKDTETVAILKKQQKGLNRKINLILAKKTKELMEVLGLGTLYNSKPLHDYYGT